MEKIACIFDYFKRAFHLNKNNRGLYKPQIALIILRTSYIIIAGFIMYKAMVNFGDTGFTKEAVLTTLLNIGGLGVILFFVSVLAGIFVEAGLYNMYKSCINEGTILPGSFSEGVKKYLLRFIAVDILVLLMWIVMFIPFIIIGVVTLAAGFVLIPLLFTIFTIMWKVIMVMEEAMIIESLKGSIRFAKMFFWPLGAVVVIQNAFMTIASGGAGGGGSGNSNLGSFNQSSNQLDGSKITDGVEKVQSTFYEWFPDVLSFFKLGLYIAIPVISIAVVISSLVKMVFKIFFGLSIFVMYSEKSSKQSPEIEMEVL